MEQQAKGNEMSTDSKPVTIESLQAKVNELMTQNTFLKKKNHELTFRLMVSFILFYI